MKNESSDEEVFSSDAEDSDEEPDYSPD